ncbi:class F sortase [Actinotalea sp. BY-33]|uniref:Class F sortase n=1 Tax=Actinotalea soli TaxID=2819234 RepID=A0A939LP35_9CELL|nr:class F sortase [Actinotalea soli]MBO1751023.1 class F sortase [Actinotalea soli]
MSRSTTRRGRAAAAVISATVLVLAGCSSTQDDTADAPAPVTSPTAEPEPEETRPPLPDVPVQSTDLEALAASAAVEPTSLTIPALDISLPIDPVGVEEDGQMEIPPLAERAGWYRYGASPGEEDGTAVVAAHVDSVASAGMGPFAKLMDVEEGDTVEVTLADGATVEYSVTDVTVLAKPQVTWPEVFVRDGEHRLVLVTCGGTFEREARSYTDNVIVTAVPVGA